MFNLNSARLLSTKDKNVVQQKRKKRGKEEYDNADEMEKGRNPSACMLFDCHFYGYFDCCIDSLPLNNTVARLSCACAHLLLRISTNFY